MTSASESERTSRANKSKQFRWCMSYTCGRNCAWVATIALPSCQVAHCSTGRPFHCTAAGRTTSAYANNFGNQKASPSLKSPIWSLRLSLGSPWFISSAATHSRGCTSSLSLLLRYFSIYRPGCLAMCPGSCVHDNPGH